MSGTYEQSHSFREELPAKAWEIVLPWFSDRAVYCIFYLDLLWKNEAFREHLARTRRLIIDWSAEKKRSEQTIIKNVAMIVDGFAFAWQLPNLIGQALATDILHEILGEHETHGHFLLGIVAGLYVPLLEGELELLKSLLAGELGRLRGYVMFIDRLHQVPPVTAIDPPILLPIPLIAESKSDYLSRVEKCVIVERNMLECPCNEERCSEIRELISREGIFQRFTEQLGGYRFRNPDNALAVIREFAADYYEKWAALRNTIQSVHPYKCGKTSNRNYETMKIHAKQAYLRVVEKKSWSKIAEAVKLSRSAVSESTPRIIEVLEIPTETSL